MKNASFEKIKSLIRKSIANPKYFVRTLRGLIRGTCYLIYFNYVKRNIKIKFPFLVHAKVRISGPGTVSIGKNCMVMKNTFKGLTITTLSKNARVIIGDQCALGGTTIRCSGLVEIGRKTMTAISLIQDSFLVNQDRLGEEIRRRLPQPQDIAIGTNAWLAESSFVMNGSKIGNDSVLSSGSWCYNTASPEYVLLSGNPVRSTIPIDKLLRLKGEQ
jgi:acetyltransferase-like isoleucine patch superfamily enzyme